MWYPLPNHKKADLFDEIGLFLCFFHRQRPGFTDRELCYE